MNVKKQLGAATVEEAQGTNLKHKLFFSIDVLRLTPYSMAEDNKLIDCPYTFMKTNQKHFLYFYDSWRDL